MEYDFKCATCKNIQPIKCSPDEIGKIEFPKCNKCNSATYRVFYPAGIKIDLMPFDFGKGMDADKDERQVLERTGGWNG